MMRPHLLARMAGSARRVVWKAEERSIARIVSHFATGNVLERRDMLDAGIVDDDVDALQLARASR